MGSAVLGEPARGFGFRDDREDFNGFGRDVIENSNLPNPEAILRLAQATQALDSALAYPGWLVPQVPFEGVAHLGAPMGWQRPVAPRRRRGHDDLVAHLAGI
jgi:hypothetical protein